MILVPFFDISNQKFVINKKKTIFFLYLKAYPASTYNLLRSLYVRREESEKVPPLANVGSLVQVDAVLII